MVCWMGYRGEKKNETFQFGLSNRACQTGLVRQSLSDRGCQTERKELLYKFWKVTQSMFGGFCELTFYIFPNPPANIPSSSLGLFRDKFQILSGLIKLPNGVTM